MIVRTNVARFTVRRQLARRPGGKVIRLLSGTSGKHVATGVGELESSILAQAQDNTAVKVLVMLKRGGRSSSGVQMEIGSAPRCSTTLTAATPRSSASSGSSSARMSRTLTAVRTRRFARDDTLWCPDHPCRAIGLCLSEYPMNGNGSSQSFQPVPSSLCPTGRPHTNAHGLLCPRCSLRAPFTLEIAADVSSGGSLPRPRHRRQYGNLLRRPRRAARVAAIPRSRASRHGLGDVRETGRNPRDGIRRAGELLRVAKANTNLHRPRRIHADKSRPRRHQRTGATARLARNDESL